MLCPEALNVAAYIGDNLPTSWALQGATQTSLHNRWLPTWSGTTVCMPPKAQFDQKRRSRADTHELTAIAFVAFGLVGCPASASMRHRGSTAARAHASEGAGVWNLVRAGTARSRRTAFGRRGCVAGSCRLPAAREPAAPSRHIRPAGTQIKQDPTRTTTATQSGLSAACFAWPARNGMYIGDAYCHCAASPYQFVCP